MTNLVENCFFWYAYTQYAYTQYPTHRLLLISKFQNLKSQNIILNYFMTSWLENCFVCIPTHIMPSQNAYTVCLAVCLTVCLYSIPQYAYRKSLTMPTHSVLDTDPHLSVSFTFSNLEIKKYFVTRPIEKKVFVMPTHCMHTHNMPTQYA